MNRVLLAALVLVAATPCVAATDLTATFQCGDTLVSGTFAIGQATLTVDRNQYVLPQVPSGSGAKYETGSGADQVLFWSSGDEAILKIGDNSLPPCVRVEPPASD